MTQYLDYSGAGMAEPKMPMRAHRHESHACLFFQSEDERQAGLVPFFEQAVENHSKILYAYSGDSPQPLIDGLLASDLDLAALANIGQLEFLSTEALLRREAEAEGEARGLGLAAGMDVPPYLTGPVAARVRKASRMARDQGYETLCLSIEMPSGEAAIGELEAEFNRRSPTKTGSLPVPLVVLCQYDRRNEGYQELLDALVSHPQVMTAQGTYKNTLYVPPPESDQDSALKKRFEDWLNQIVEQQEIQERLAYSERMYSTIIEASPDAIVLVGRSGNIGFASQAALLLFGFSSPEEIRGQMIWDHIVAEDRERARGRVVEVLSGGPPRGDHFLLRRKNGEIFTGEIYARAFFNEHGNAEGMVAVLRDITDRIKMQASLVESEERYRTISGMVSDFAICMRMDEEGHTATAWATEAFKTITGYSPDELALRGGLYSIAHPDDQIYVEHQRQKLYAGMPTVSEYRIVRPDGSVRWLYQFGRPFMDAETGQMTHYYLVGQDITARKQAEADLEESEQTARALLDTSPSSSLLIDPNGKLLAGNEPLARFFKRPLSELLGKEVMELFPAEMVPILRSRIELVLATGEPVMVKEDAGGRSFDTTIYPICDHEGIVRRIAISVTDVTVYTRAEATERQQRLFAETLLATSEALAHTLDIDSVLDAVTTNLMVLAPEAAVNIMLLEHGGQVRSLRYFDPRYPEQPIRTSERGELAVQLEFHSTRNLLEMAESQLPLIIEDTGAYEGWINHPANQWVRSQAAVPIISGQTVIGFLCLENGQPGFFNAEHAELLRHFASQAATALQKAIILSELQHSHDELQEAYDATIQGLAKALEMRDKETEGHSRRVVLLTTRLGERMGFSGAELNAMRWGSLLHDIGKMGVPDSILLKPNPLTEDEWVIMRQHPRYAHNIIDDIPYLRRASDIPLYHHERYDGKGYPMRLKGETIPLPARIFAAVDTLDALMKDRPYRPAWPIDDVLSHLQAEAGKQFDPRVVDELLKMIEEEPELMERLYG